MRISERFRTFVVCGVLLLSSIDSYATDCPDLTMLDLLSLHDKGEVQKGELTWRLGTRSKKYLRDTINRPVLEGVSPEAIQRFIDEENAWYLKEYSTLSLMPFNPQSQPSLTVDWFCGGLSGVCRYPLSQNLRLHSDKVIQIFVTDN